MEIQEKLDAAAKLLNVNDSSNRIEILHNYWKERCLTASLPNFEYHKRIISITRAKNTFMESWALEAFKGTENGEVFIPREFPEEWKINGCKECKGVGIYKFVRKSRGLAACRHCIGTGLRSFPCKSCSGTGTIKGEEKENKCSTCVGTGKWQNRTLQTREMCPHCQGSGDRRLLIDSFVNAKICMHCEGHGLSGNPIDLINNPLAIALNDAISEKS